MDFWTYSCINCLRTLPYIKAWNEKYKDSGLVIIGVHTPEFPFEKDEANVRKAVKDLGIVYPVPMDNNYKIWRSFNNEYWPADYFIDATGRSVFTTSARAVTKNRKDGFGPCWRKRTMRLFPERDVKLLPAAWKLLRIRTTFDPLRPI